VKDRHPVTFSQLRVANLGRCLEVFHPLEDWSPTDWATAVSGEVGEACNLIKKMRRGEPVAPMEVASELADAVIYLDLLAARLGIDLGRAVAYKFNHVSDMRKSSFRILPDPSNPCPLGYLPPDQAPSTPEGK